MRYPRSLHRFPALFLGAVALVAAFACIRAASATVYLTSVSDLLSTSAPGALTNQTITFTLNQAVPASGAIEVLLNQGGFSIPAALNYTDVDIAFSATPEGPYTDRPVSSVRTAGTDRIAVTPGSAGKVRIELNTTVGIPAGNVVQIEIGTNATYGSIGDQRVTLGNATGTKPVTITTYDAAGNELDYGRTLVVIVTPVSIGPVDTTDTIPPSITYAAPTGILQVGTRAVQLYVTTDESAECRFATSSMAFTLMPYYFYGTSTGLVRSHFAQVSGLEDGTAYSYYLRCRDYRRNEMNPDYLLEFRVGIVPGSATTTSTTTSYGTGTGTSSATSTASSTGPGPSTDTGTGTGASGTGSGSSANGGTGSGGGSGGSGGSSPGTQLPQADVRIDGWAYPGATVSFIRDGTVVTTGAAGSDAAFSHLTEGLDRGSYTLSVYAVDSKGVRGATFTTTLWLRSETLNTLSNIMLPPTVAVASNEVDPGTPLAVSGYSAPNARITTWLRPRLAEVSVGDVVSTTTAAGNGAWALSVPTTGLSQGTYELVAQAWMPDGLIQSDKSARKTIGIGVSVADDTCLSRGDLNCDGFVNLVDFSILLFNWNTPSATADINADGIVSLPDFSIMLYNWTG